MTEPAVDDQLHRAYVGPLAEYDIGAAHQFNLLTLVLGLREYHHLLEIGCGSLRAGRLFISYLLADHYCGLEPNAWLVEAGLDRELGRDLARLRRPRLRHDQDFSLAAFEREFDFVVAQSIFSHAAPAQIARCFQQVSVVLARDGVFVASFQEQAADHAGETWVYPESVGYTLPTIVRHAQAHGLVCRPLAWGNQNMQRWVLVHRPECSRSLPELDELTTRRAEVAVLRGRLESMARPGVSPAAFVRLQERLLEIGRHPAVRAAMAGDAALRAAVHGATPARDG